MATVDQIQTAMDPTQLGAKIIRGPYSHDALLDGFFVRGGIGSRRSSRNGVFVQTTRSDSAATQAAAMLAALRTT